MQTVKPLTEFYKSKANADGYDGRCKVLRWHADTLLII
jgi:hypothetical protein